MAHFKNLSIDEENKIKEAFFLWKAIETFNLTKGEDMFGSPDQKPSESKIDKFAGLGPGTHCVIFNDMNTGVSDNTGQQYWKINFTTDDGKSFDHFINCEPNEYKSEEKVFNAIARQVDALFLYESIGQHEKLETYVQAAIDKVWMLKDKKLEFTIKKWKMDGKEGLWGEITGYLDTPNEAIQKGIQANTSDEFGF